MYIFTHKHSAWSSKRHKVTLSLTTTAL